MTRALKAPALRESVWDLESGESALSPLTGHDGPVHAVAVAKRQGRPVIVSGSGDGTVRVWDLESGEPRGRPVLSAYLSGRGSLINCNALS